MRTDTAYEGIRTERVPGTRENPVSITMLTKGTKEVLEHAFPGLWVSGEVSDFKKGRNGHWYFSLRDAQSKVSCVIWASDQLGIPAAPDEGMKVIALGKMTVYSAAGAMQLCIRKIEAEGDGLWRKALKIAYNKLKADGLVAPERKRALPVAPRCVAIVTSPQGAALHDIIVVINRRCPGTEIVLSPCRVQGDGSANDIRRALEKVKRWGGADVVIIGRGGGGREDLWAFNDEMLARAIAAFPVPVIAAIGHEIDTTLCDLVADHRAPTPSAAAEAAVPDMDQLRRTMVAFDRQMRSSLTRRVRNARNAFRSASESMGRRATRIVQMKRMRVTAAAGKLNALSPLAVLSRGYSVTRSADGSALVRLEQFEVGMDFVVRVVDGNVPSRVTGAPTELDRPAIPG